MERSGLSLILLTPTLLPPLTSLPLYHPSPFHSRPTPTKESLPGMRGYELQICGPSCLSHGASLHLLPSQKLSLQSQTLVFTSHNTYLHTGLRGNDHFLGVFGDNVYKAASGIQGQRERVQGYMPQKIKSWHPRVTGASWRSDPLKQGTETPPCSGRETVAQHGHVSFPRPLEVGQESFPGFSSLHQQNGCQPSGW